MKPQPLKKKQYACSAFGKLDIAKSCRYNSNHKCAAHGNFRREHKVEIFTSNSKGVKVELF